MFALLVAIAAALTVPSALLFMRGLLRKRWLLCIGAALPGSGAVAAGVFAYRRAPAALLEFLGNDGALTTTALVLAALSLAISMTTLSARMIRSR